MGELRKVFSVELSYLVIRQFRKAALESKLWEGRDLCPLLSNT